MWYGQVSGSGGELVEVQARDCGTTGPFYTIAETAPGRRRAATRSRANPPSLPTAVRWSAGQTYRARWGDQLSEPARRAAVSPRPVDRKGASPAGLEGARQPQRLSVEPYVGREAGRAPAQTRPVVDALQERAAEAEGELDYEDRRVQPRGGVRGADPRPDAAGAAFPPRRRRVAPCYLGKATEPWRT